MTGAKLCHSARQMPKARSYCALQMSDGLSRHFLSTAIAGPRTCQNASGDDCSFNTSCVPSELDSRQGRVTWDSPRCRGSKFAEAGYGWGSELPGDGSQGAGQLSRRVRRHGGPQARCGDPGDQRTGLCRTPESDWRPARPTWISSPKVSSSG